MVAKLIKKSNQTLVSLDEAKAHLRILHNSEDFYLNALLDVVTTAIENHLDKDLVDTQYSFYLYSKVGLGEEIHFPNSPIYSVSSVVIKHGETLVDASEYSYTYTDEYISFDSLPDDYTELVINYRKGFESSEDLPTPIKQAALLMLSDHYLYRGSIIVGKSLVVMEKSIDALLRPYRNVKFM